MARFIADIQGQAGPTSRIGNRNSGIRSHTRGWNIGVEVHGNEMHDGRDVFRVYVTGGSNGAGSRKEIFEVLETEDGIEINLCNNDTAKFDKNLNPLVTFHNVA